MGVFFHVNQLLDLVAMVTWSYLSHIIGRIENWHLLRSHCRYFDKTFIEMSLKKSSFSHVCFGPLLILMICNGNQTAKTEKRRKRNNNKNNN